MASPTAPALIVEELRRQVDHQLTAAASHDTKAAGLIAATFALVALVVPRVHVNDPVPAALTAVTFIFAILTLWFLLQVIRPQVGGFSYGPSADSLRGFAQDEADVLEREMVDAFVDARNGNEGVLQAKADSLVWGIRCLIVVVVGLGAMLAGGAIS